MLLGQWLADGQVGRKSHLNSTVWICHLQPQSAHSQFSHFLYDVLEEIQL